VEGEGAVKSGSASHISTHYFFFDAGRGVLLLPKSEDTSDLLRSPAGRIAGLVEDLDVARHIIEVRAACVIISSHCEMLESL
jgi:hypothetical protein